MLKVIFLFVVVINGQFLDPDADDNEFVQVK